MARSSNRVLWKGAISFGLVHIPVALHSASTDSGIDFDWLDKRSMDPVGYKRINKKTGREIDKANIVKGIQYEKGRYVVLTDEEIKAAYPRTTQTVEIECFVPLAEVPFVYLDRPYYLSPVAKGEKVYALLREALTRSGRAGIARVVIQTRQHLAALVPSGPVLVLNLLRWGESIRPVDTLDLPPAGTKEAGLKPRELEMAEQLIDDMGAHWDPAQFHDSFAQEVMKLVDQKVEAGQTETVIQPEAAEPGMGPSNIVDLTELLQRSLRGRKAAPAKKKGESAPAAGTQKKKRNARAAAAHQPDASARSRSAHRRRKAA